MKPSPPIANFPLPILKRRVKTGQLPSSRTTHRGLFTPHSQRGIALVVTLLLLSIITFMAVTFLVVSRSQKGSVVTATDQAIARLAADTALERAKAAIIVPILAQTNEFNYGLLVSTDYISRDGFTNNSSSPLNVNYDFDSQTHLPLTAAERVQNIANLLYDPRPPVFITTNRFQTTPAEFRFYLDLNRNGRYDTNGFLPVVNSTNGFYDLSGNLIAQIQLGNTLSNLFVGDPEWIGTLERPEFAHSADNKFVNRYAFIVVPIGQALDVNCIHNYATKLTPTDMSRGDGFLRNQGILTSEINLGAFLTDLNTNLWPSTTPNGYNFAPYVYYADPARHNTGAAFDDASALLRYRSAFNWANLANVRNLFGAAGVFAFTSAFIDAYSGGPVMTGTTWPPSGNNPNPTRVSQNYPWAGADNPNRFFTTQDFFDQGKTRPPWLPPKGVSFTDRLLMAGTNNDSYNRYTFYRLLSQLGTDSAPEPPGKMNLNYCNVDNNGHVVPNMATNFIPWAPVQFFTNAANRLLADAGYNFTTTNIQIWPTNFYTASVHRLLQVAANMYDATTNRTDLSGYPHLPHVFRPVFNPLQGKAGTIIYISGYQEVTNTAVLNDPIYDLSNANDRSRIKPTGNMVYGIPLVIGAKKGFPNFNELAMQTQVQVTRKLQFLRPNGSTTLPVNQTNQMFVVTISNVFGVEAWNSYGTNFPRNLRITVLPDVSVVVTNETGTAIVNQRYVPQQPAVTNIAAGAWPAYDQSQEQYSFVIPVSTNLLFLTNSTYSRRFNTFVPLTGSFESASPAFYVPHWWLNLRTRLRFALLDTSVSPMRIVDYVNFDSPSSTNLTEILPRRIADQTNNNCGSYYTPNGSDDTMWCTNHFGSVADESQPTYGIMNQIAASLALPNVTPNWNSALHEFPLGLDKNGAIDFFRAQFDLPPLTYFNTPFQKTNVFNAPFQPVRGVYFFSTWQANDPLVHYMVDDLRDLRRKAIDFTTIYSTLPNLGRVNERYEPWGGNPSSRSSSQTKTLLQVKDPLVKLSDNWDFPTNRFPNVGWLGRVHRGTPWQTLYLKSPAIDLLTWTNWTGNGRLVVNYGQISPSLVTVATNLAAIPASATVWDSVFTYPTNDWRLLDLFTAALNDNATRGQLSINQTNLAAWSAVLSGVQVLTNYDASGNPGLTPTTIQPAGVHNPYDRTTWPPVVRIVNGINNVRANTNTFRPVFTGQVFHRLGDILSVPELTVASPFLSTNVPPSDPANFVVNDATYERIPQQILGLLKADPVPRFVVYSYGQALKPSAKVPNGTFFNLCTNYQITAEAATRAVVRVEGAPANPRVVVENFSVLPPD